ncbi:uncharacterized protein [Ciconia boyciana]|uniref:uncharacterized protein n=1 Tax=Ciconia boyciana TaxID=52775 RepID=UPI003BA3230B
MRTRSEVVTGSPSSHSPTPRFDGVLTQPKICYRQYPITISPAPIYHAGASLRTRGASPLRGGRCQIRGAPAARQLRPASPLPARAFLSGALTLPRTIQSDRRKQKILEFPQPRSAASRSQVAAPGRDFALGARDEPVTERSRDGYGPATAALRAGERRAGKRSPQSAPPSHWAAGAGEGRAAARGERRAERGGGAAAAPAPITGEGGGRVGGRGGARPQSGGAAGRGAPAAAPRPAQHRRRPLHARIPNSPLPQRRRRAQEGRRKKERGKRERGRAKLPRANAPSHPPHPPARPRCSSSGRRKRRRSGSSPSPAAGAAVHESGGAEPAAPELSGVTSSRSRPPWVSRFPFPLLAAAASASSPRCSAAAGLVPPQDTLKEPHLHGPRTAGAARPSPARRIPPRPAPRGAGAASRSLPPPAAAEDTEIF